MFDFAFNQKVAFVTGVGDNLGANICEKLAKAGAEVWVHCFNENDAVNIQQKIGGTVHVIISKLHTPEVVQAVVRDIIKNSCKIDILINHAESATLETIDQLTTEKWIETFETNLDIPFLCCQEIIPFMLQKGEGVIINISSRAAETGEIGPHYAATKSALDSFTIGLSREFKGSGIKVRGISPPVSLHDKTLTSKARGRVMEAMANNALLHCSHYLEYEVDERSRDGEVLKK